MYKSADRDRVVSHKKLTEMYKAHSIAMKRDQKDEWAKIQIQHLRDMKLKKAMEKKMRWEEKMAQVHNVKDLAEFKRGLMLADITLQDDRYQMWR
jgi:hypothetical protein